MEDNKDKQIWKKLTNTSNRLPEGKKVWQGMFSCSDMRSDYVIASENRQ